MVKLIVIHKPEILNQRFLMKKKAFQKFKGLQSLGTWEFMWQAAVFMFVCILVFSILVGFFIYVIMCAKLDFPPYESWSKMSEMHQSLLSSLALSMLIFSFLLTLLLLELYDRIIYRPVKSLLSEIERISGYRGISNQVDYYLRGGKNNPFETYSPQESIVDRVRDYLEHASKDRYFDDITGCFNRKYLANVLTEILKTQLMCSITNRSIPKNNTTVCYALYLIDIDHFKAINDEFGHLYGDQVLAQVGRTLRSCVGSDGVVIRSGGEEFLLVVCHHYPMDYASYAEHVRAEFSDTVFVTSPRTSEVRPVTCSIGFVPFPLYDQISTAISVAQHVELTDQAMYLAKSGGRNTWRGVEPIVPPDGSEEIQNITSSIEYGIRMGNYRIIKPGIVEDRKNEFVAMQYSQKEE